MLDNKYSKWYFNIINSYNSSNIPENIYCENHHIMPKCIELNNLSENIVCVRMKDHVIFHHLLTKMFEGNIKRKMMHSYHRIIFGKNNEIQTPIRIERARKLHVENMSGENHHMWGKFGEKHSSWGRKQTKEAKRKIGIASKGRKRSVESRKKQSESISGKNNHMYGKERTNEWKEEQSERLKGKYKGGNNPNSKLTEEKAIQIKSDPRLWVRGGIQELVVEYGVHETTISGIKFNRIWKHI